MATRSPIIKRVQNFKFELIDFYELYSHMPVIAKHGKAFIENVNQLENTVTYRPLNNPKVSFTSDVRSVKLMLRRLEHFRSKDIKVIAGLALDTQGFDGTVSRDGNKTIMQDEEERRVVVDLSDGNVAISVSIKGKAQETQNIPFIMAYMIRNGFDLYNLTNRGYAISVSSIDVRRGF